MDFGRLAFSTFVRVAFKQEQLERRLKIQLRANYCFLLTVVCGAHPVISTNPRPLTIASRASPLMSNTPSQYLIETSIS